MTTSKATMRSGNSARRMDPSATDAIDAAEQFADDALDAAAESAAGLSFEAASVLKRAAGRVGAHARNGAHAMRGGYAQARGRAGTASATAVRYIQAEPFKSVLIAAAAGAFFVTLAGAVRRGRHHD